MNNKQAMMQWIIIFIKTGRTVMKVQCEKPSLALVGLMAGWLARSEMKYRCTWIFEYFTGWLI